jgi:hypothetical protein
VVVLSASLSDSPTDAIIDPRTGVSPDLVSGSIEIANGNFNFRVVLNEASIDPPTAYMQIYLDLDENPATGAKGIQQAVDLNIIGAEAWLTFLDGLTRVELIRCPTTSCIVAGSFPVSRAGGVFSGTVPMSQINNDDGRMGVKMSTYVGVNNVGTGTPADVMPNVGQPAVAVR